MNAAEFRSAVDTLKKIDIKPHYKAPHPSCCKGNRTANRHSPYCFSLKGFYVMTLAPGALSRKILRKARRRLEMEKS